VDNQKQGKKYLEAQIKTASKEQLLIMLYDGAIQACQAAEILMDENKREPAGEKLMKAQNIVAELISSLHFDKNEEVAKNLAALYGYVYIQLMEANTKQSKEQIQNSKKILEGLRETWIEAFAKVGLNQEAKNKTKSDQKSETGQGGLSIQA